MQYDHTIVFFLSDIVVALCVCFFHQEPPLLWRIFVEDFVTLSEGGAVATQALSGMSLTTSGTEITKGKHYWEVELLSEGMSMIFIGIIRPKLVCTDSWFITADGGYLYGNGRYQSNGAGAYKQGDRVGVLLDLDNGSLRFFKNGVAHGPGYAAGSVTGPVVVTVQMYCKDESVRLLPNAEAPAGV
jgi:hypothetical protein